MKEYPRLGGEYLKCPVILSDVINVGPISEFKYLGGVIRYGAGSACSRGYEFSKELR